MAFCYRLIKPRKQTQTLIGDARDDYAAVTDFALSRNQPASFEAIQQPRDVGIFSDQPLADFAARYSLPACAAKYAQNVILSRRQVYLLEHLVDTRPQHLRRALDVEIDFFFAADKRSGLLQLFLQLSPHVEQYNRYNDYCQDEHSRC